MLAHDPRSFKHIRPHIVELRWRLGHASSSSKAMRESASARGGPSPSRGRSSCAPPCGRRDLPDARAQAACRRRSHSAAPRASGCFRWWRPAAAPEHRLAPLHRERERFLVHPRHHEHLERVRVLHDAGDQPIGVVSQFRDVHDAFSSLANCATAAALAPSHIRFSMSSVDGSKSAKPSGSTSAEVQFTRKLGLERGVLRFDDYSYVNRLLL